MSKRVTKSTLSKVNQLLSIDDSYKAPGRIMEILLDDELKRDTFFNFLEAFDYDLNYEWFYQYFQDEHADRKNNKQDFTPTCLSRLMSEILSVENKGVIYEPSCGTGSTIIQHWVSEKNKCRVPWEFNVFKYFYVCEELSDKTIPFLLFNLLIRGMHSIVIHGNSLTRECKNIYYCETFDFMSFGKLYVLEHSQEMAELFNIKWVDVSNE